MASAVMKLKQAVKTWLQRPERPKPPPRHDGSLVGGSRAREIAEASPERAGELAGHAVERVDT